MEKNDVTSFFFYMWNKWSKEECEIAFQKSNCMWQHFWQKYVAFWNEYGSDGAIAKFYAELSDENRDLLVKRATELYDRRHELKGV